jgi:N-dimethylarginine dimethylaminohydrolase
MRLLMCPPEHFDVTYEINPWMDVNVPVDRDRAMRQWEVLYETYIKLGAAIEILRPEPRLPDMVFTANAGFVAGNSVLLPRFKSPKRQPETMYYRTWFKSHGYQTFEPDGIIEGRGEVVPVGDYLVAGAKQRADRMGIASLARVTDRQVIVVDLIDPQFYHIDMCMNMLGGVLAFHPPAFQYATHTPNVIDSSIKTYRIYKHDMHAFAINSMVFPCGTIVMPNCNIPFKQALLDSGSNIVEVDVSEFIKAGGAIKCMTLQLDEFST